MVQNQSLGFVTIIGDIHHQLLCTNTEMCNDIREEGLSKNNVNRVESYYITRVIASNQGDLDSKLDFKE